MLKVYCKTPQLKHRMIEQRTKAHAGDCGLDLFVYGVTMPDMRKPPHVKIGSGVHVAAYDELGRPTGCLLYPRSSISKTPFLLANSVGVIDAGYRGEVLAKLVRMDNSVQTVNLDDKDLRLVQICLPSLRPVRVQFVDSLEALGTPPDNRGSGGFGSTNRTTVMSAATPIAD